MKKFNLKSKIGTWKLTAVITFAIAVYVSQSSFATTMKSAGWPDAGVVWTTAISTNYRIDGYWTNFPSYSSSATMNDFVPALSFDKHLSKKEIKIMKRMEKKAAEIKEKMSNQKTVANSSNFNPGWPKDFGPYYSGWAHKRGDSYSKVIPTGMYTDGEDYFIVYNVVSNSYSYEYMNAYYDIKSTTYKYENYKYIHWREKRKTVSSQAYVQKIDKNGTVISDMGIPITTGDDYESYSLDYHRYHYTGGYNNVSIYYEDTNYFSGSIGGASLIDCGKNLLISGQRTKPGKGRRAPSEVLDSGIYYVTKSNSLEKLEWPSWCSGKFVGLSSGHKTSGRENKYIHAFGGDSGKRVWRLLPR